jgi:DDE superfamily endonuclease
MNRDKEGERNGYTANSYLDILEEQISICYEPGRTFMQDNARIHTAKKVKSWLADNGIPLLNWPPYSPDINPIEHLWVKIKEWINKQYPELSNIGKSEEAHTALARAIVEAWEAIPQSYIDKLIEGMPRRVEFVRKKKGWHTRY